jgi:hypothetical protein
MGKTRLNPKGIALYSPRLPSIGEATLGPIVRKISNRNAVAQPLQLMSAFNAGPKVARVRATLGFRAESPWGSLKMQP